ncbi:MAG TPA: plastocyanin/azurin family copper-binding protein [Baekduia sp.]|nr:plastocyanin/azurin family copper-binding protein [Baekduia sp.]
MPKRALVALLTLSCVPALSACGQEEPDLVAGKQLFVERCGSCHVLNRAATKGNSGPNLDAAFSQSVADGMGRDAIEGVIEDQIKDPRRGSMMPADLVKGDDVSDVSAYVARSVARGGEDEGVLADAVKKAGGGEVIAAKDGKLVIPADPGGQLAYVSSKATAPAGPIDIESPNESAVPHNIVIDAFGPTGKGAVVQDGGVSKISGTVKAGETYSFYCSVPGHRAAGMEGELTVE